MTVRMWRACVSQEELDRYRDFLQDIWIPRLLVCPQNQGAVTLERAAVPACAELLVISLWTGDPPAALDFQSLAPQDPLPVMGAVYECTVRGPLALGLAALESGGSDP